GTKRFELVRLEVRERAAPTLTLVEIAKAVLHCALRLALHLGIEAGIDLEPAVLGLLRADVGHGLEEALHVVRVVILGVDVALGFGPVELERGGERLLIDRFIDLLRGSKAPENVRATTH